MGLSAHGKKIVAKMATLQEVRDAAQEPALEMTENHYAHYASVIQALGKAVHDDTKTGHYLAAEALKLAGGNATGIDNAMWAMFGHADYDPMERMLGAR